MDFVHRAITSLVKLAYLDITLSMDNATNVITPAASVIIRTRKCLVVVALILLGSMRFRRYANRALITVRLARFNHQDKSVIPALKEHILLFSLVCLARITVRPA